MRPSVKTRSRKSWLVQLEVSAFASIIALSWADELMSLPRIIFGGEHVSNWQEAAMETLVVLVVAIPVLLVTKGIVARLHYLEGFLRVCAWCKQTEHEGQRRSVVLSHKPPGRSVDIGVAPSVGRRSVTWSVMTLIRGSSVGGSLSFLPLSVGFGRGRLARTLGRSAPSAQVGLYAPGSRPRGAHAWNRAGTMRAKCSPERAILGPT